MLKTLDATGIHINNVCLIPRKPKYYTWCLIEIYGIQFVGAIYWRRDSLSE